MDRPFILDDTLGAAFIGVVVAAVLYGISAVQAWYYFGHQNDNWSIKILVEVIFNGFTALLVQSFLAMRVWRLSNGKKLWMSFVGLLVLGEFGCVVAFTSMSLHLTTYAQLESLKYLSILVNALAAAGDVLIAATLCFNLHFSRTGFSRSNTMINKLILFSVNTGGLTSLCAIASLISIVCAGETFLYISFFFCIGRLYTNSLLATLNARRMIRNLGNAVHTGSGNGTAMVSLQTFPKGGHMASRERATGISIKFDTTKQFVTNSDHEHDVEKAEISISTPTAQEFLD
ncbi:hypothetical protein HYPSUDRAFT_202593 [Hypholoma sublateritium FD-334 SS-4]|uniref:DUF6534 domain-containing protein n=1 Tax=Hypholoma sublateritium (strain FD-334 SS-4) TaxID=945553 RepID=A0A0D2MEA0_HYPSF|nr:hypothetical protein HYPSUDRAFT_209715 [Hypholoma sublateritium FD-334 SS-4]KJA21898.1 hypothetical protein HYPSUDRAFT_202593 [Hypholoma sublateritium FD-334 SS-4]